MKDEVIPKRKEEIKMLIDAKSREIKETFENDEMYKQLSRISVILATFRFQNNNIEATVNDFKAGLEELRSFLVAALLRVEAFVY